MRLSRIIALTAATLGTLGLGGLVRAANADHLIAGMTSNQSNVSPTIHIAEEANDLPNDADSASEDGASEQGKAEDGKTEKQALSQPAIAPQPKLVAAPKQSDQAEQESPNDADSGHEDAQ